MYYDDNSYDPSEFQDDFETMNQNEADDYAHELDDCDDEPSPEDNDWFV